MVLTNEGYEQATIIDTSFKESKNALPTLELTIVVNAETTIYVKEENLISFYDKLSLKWHFFVIKEIVSVDVAIEKTISVYCESYALELIDGICKIEFKDTTATLSQNVASLVAPTRFDVNPSLPVYNNPDIVFTEETLNKTVLEVLQMFANSYGLTIDIEFNYDGSVITSRYVTLIQSVGVDTGFVFEYDYNVDSIERTVDSSNVKTAIYPIGGVPPTPEGWNEETQGEWVSAPVNIVSVHGEDTIVDEVATALWGFSDPSGVMIPRYVFYKNDDILDPEVLKQDATRVLQTINAPVFNYKITLNDLYALSGYTDSNNKVNLGDTVTVVDRAFLINYVVTTTVVSRTVDLLNPSSTVLELGSLIKTIASVTSSTSNLGSSTGALTNVMDNIAVVSNAVGIIDELLAGNLTAINISAGTIQANSAIIADGAIGTAHIGTGVITDAKIDRASVNKLVVTDADIVDASIHGAKIKNATIDTAQMKLASITKALIGVGAVGTLQVEDGSITDAKIVELSANRITSGQLSTDRLIIRDPSDPTKSLIFEINNISGALQAVQGDTLNGEILTPRTITADKIVANEITANEIASHTITANEILANTITANEIESATITSTEIKADTITVNNLKSDVGANLDISSNVSITSRVTNTTYEAGINAITPHAVTLSNYSQPVPTNALGVTTSIVTLITNVDCFKGTTRMAGTIGTLVFKDSTGATVVTGITLSKTNPTSLASGSVTVSISSSNTLPTDTGTVLIPVTVESNTYNVYISWSKAKVGATGSQGIQGEAGEDGNSLYTWVKYATTPTTGMSDTPDGKTYIGFAYNKTTPTESLVYGDYTWSLIKGTDGATGTTGTDGVTYYTWIKYADTITGTGMSDSPTNKRYLGIATNKTSATESLVTTDYTWSPLYDNVVVGARNYIVTTTLLKGKYIVDGTGLLGDAPNHSTTDFIPVTPLTAYMLSSILLYQLRVYFYDTNKALVSGTLYGSGQGNQKVINTPANTYFIRFSGDEVNGSPLSQWKFEKGNIATDWSQAPEDVKAYTDSLELGARNLFLNSAWRKDDTGWGSGTRDTTVLFEGINSLKNPVLTSGSRDIYSNQISIKAGETYTVSYWIKSDINIANMANMQSFFIVSGDGTTVYPTQSYGDLVSGVWKKITHTYLIPTGKTLLIYAWRNNVNSLGTIWISKPKLEKGTKATDWTEAPEDIQTQLDGALVRIDTAESKITPTAIVDTVRTSSSYISDLSAKATTSALTTTNTNVATAQGTADIALIQGLITSNSTFSKWTGTYPVGFSIYSTGLTKETVLTRSGGNACRGIVTNSATQHGLAMGSSAFISNVSNSKYLYLELDFMLVSGVIAGSGVLLDWTGMNPYRNTIKLVDYVPSPTLGKWHTIRLIIKRPTDTLTGWTGMAGYLMANYSAIGAGVKDIVFDRLAIREATDSEIKTFEDIPALTTRVSSAETTITQQATAITSKVSTTDFNGNNIVSIINQTATTADIIASKINLVGAVTVLSDIVGNLGTITAGMFRGASVGMTSDVSKFAFWAGETNGVYGDSTTDAKFKVSHTGALTASNANLTGTFTQYDSNGVKSLELKSNGLIVYDWQRVGDLVGGVCSVTNPNNFNRGGVSFYGDTGNPMFLSYKTATGHSSYMILDDTKTEGSQHAMISCAQDLAMINSNSVLFHALDPFVVEGNMWANDNGMWLTVKKKLYIGDSPNNDGMGGTSYVRMDSTLAEIWSKVTVYNDIESTHKIKGASLDIVSTGAVGVEIRSTNGGTPFIDLSNTAGQDYQARIYVGTSSGNLELDNFMVGISNHLYVGANCSAGSFTDRTPAYIGDALSEIANISDDGNGGIDHTTLPDFAQKTIEVDKTLYLKDFPETILVPLTKEEEMYVVLEQSEEEEGRDLGAMISILTVGIQQLTDIVNKQELRIKELESRLGL
jgi:phage minor structural protein